MKSGIMFIDEDSETNDHALSDLSSGRELGRLQVYILGSGSLRGDKYTRLPAPADAIGTEYPMVRE